MKYARGMNEDEWLTLDEIREQLPKGQWRHSSVFEQVGVAAELRVTPSEFWGWSDHDKAYMIAYYRVKSTLQEYEEVLRDKESRRKTPSRKK